MSERRCRAHKAERTHVRRSKHDWEMEKVSMREGKKLQWGVREPRSVSEKVREEESSCRSTKQGEACLQGSEPSE